MEHLNEVRHVDDVKKQTYTSLLLWRTSNWHYF